MSNPKIILQNPHFHIIGRQNDLQRCVDYRLTETVEGIETGRVGYVPPDSFSNADILKALKSLAVADINSKQSTYVFNDSDVITFERMKLKPSTKNRGS